MSTRIIATIESAGGEQSTITVDGRVVTLEVPMPGGTVALRCGPAHARRFAEALLLAARTAEAGAK